MVFFAFGYGIFRISVHIRLHHVRPARKNSAIFDGETITYAFQIVFKLPSLQLKKFTRFPDFLLGLKLRLKQI